MNEEVKNDIVVIDCVHKINTTNEHNHTHTPNAPSQQRIEVVGEGGGHFSCVGTIE